MKSDHMFAFAILCTTVFSGCAKSDEQGKTDGQYVTAAGGLNMRNAPDATASVVTLIPQGAEVTVLERKGEEVEIGGRRGKWARVSSGSAQGWVFDGFLGKAAAAQDLAALLKKGGCIPFDFESRQCSFQPGAACFEGAQLYADGTAVLGGCESGDSGTWTVSGNTITINTAQKRSAMCKTDCWFQSYDAEKAANCEAAQQCSSLTGSETKTSVLQQQGDGRFLLLPETKMGSLQVPQ